MKALNITTKTEIVTEVKVGDVPIHNVLDKACNLFDLRECYKMVYERKKTNKKPTHADLANVWRSVCLLRRTD